MIHYVKYTKNGETVTRHAVPGIRMDQLVKGGPVVVQENGVEVEVIPEENISAMTGFKIEFVSKAINP